MRVPLCPLLRGAAADQLTLRGLCAVLSFPMLGRRSIVIGRDQRNLNLGILMVPQAEEWMIERFGKFNRAAGPGLHLSIPFVESVAYKRSMKETTIPIKPQTAITKDNVHVQLCDPRGPSRSLQEASPMSALKRLWQPLEQ